MNPLRRAPPLSAVAEESPEQASQGDVIYQLGDKIRMQAKRLSTLEQYKLLCERRIAELAPGHEFPVRVDHLGTSLPQRTDSVLAENRRLECALRDEAQAAEKQRAYISSLEQALSASQREPQSSNRESELESRLREQESRSKGVEAERETLIGELEEIRIALTQMQDACQALEAEKNALLATEKDRPTQEVGNLQRELQSARQQIAKMTAEHFPKDKNPQSDSQLQATNRRLADVTLQNQSLSDELLELQTKCDEFRTANASLQAECDRLGDELRHCRLDLEAGAKQRAALQDAIRSNKDREPLEAKLRGEIRSLQDRVTDLQSETDGQCRLIAGKSEEIARLKEKLETAEANCARQTAELAAERSALQAQHELAIRNFESAISALEEEASIAKTDASSRIKFTEMDVQRLNLRIRELQDNLKAEKLAREQAESDARHSQARSITATEEKTAAAEEISALKTELAAAKSLHSKSQQVIRSLAEEKAAVVGKLSSLEEEKGRMERLVEGISSENEVLKDSLDSLQSDLEAISDNVKRTNEELSRTKDALRTEVARGQEAASDRQATLGYIKAKCSSLPSFVAGSEANSLSQRVSCVFSYMETLQNDLSALQSDNESLRRDLISARSDSDSVKSALSEALKAGNQSREQILALGTELRLAKTKLDETHTNASDHIARISSELTTFQRENHRLAAQVQQLIEKNSVLESDLLSSSSRCATFQRDLKAWEEVNSEILKESRSLDSLLTKIISGIPSPAVKSICVNMIQTRSEAIAMEKSLLKTRMAIAEKESQLSALQEPQETLQLHKSIQRDSDFLAETEQSLVETQRKLQELENELGETQREEARRGEELAEMRSTCEELQGRLDRKAAEVTQIRYEFLRTQKPERMVSPKNLATVTVSSRLEQARATLTELKRLSQSGI